MIVLRHGQLHQIALQAANQRLEDRQPLSERIASAHVAEVVRREAATRFTTA
jgi:hypothetical protein